MRGERGQPGALDRNTSKETAQGVSHIITHVGPAGVTDGWVLQTSLFPTSATDRRLGTVTAKPQSFIHGTITGAANQSVRPMRLNNTVAYYNATDEQGNYRFRGLAPGRYRVAAGGDGWRPWLSQVVDVATSDDREVNGRLHRGATILAQRNLNGRLTYRGLSPGDYTVVAASSTHFTVATVHVTTSRTDDLRTRVLNRPTLTLTGTTVPRGVVEAFSGNPTDEHPSRARSVGASGPFTVDRLAPGTVTGALSQGAGSGKRVRLGAIPLYVHG